MSSTPYLIIVDDKDANVSVTGTNVMQPYNSFQEYDRTETRINGSNTEVTLKFWGTQVQVYHTITAGVPNTLSFVLDNDDPVSIIQPIVGVYEMMHYLIHESTRALPYALHTLTTVIQIPGTIPGQDAALMVLDYFIISRPTDSDVTGMTLLYDDLHPDFQYDGMWSVIMAGPGTGNDEVNSMNMNWTLHNAVTNGSTATLQFNGSSIWVYGSIRQNSTGAIACFSIDSEPATTASVPVPAPSASLNVSANQVLYQKTSLSPGSHLLVMTALAPDMFYFDYLTVVGYGGGQGDGDRTPLPSASGSGSTSSTSIEVLSSGSTPASISNPAISLIGVAGAAVGAIVGILASATVVLAAIVIRRRHRRSREVNSARKKLFQIDPLPHDTTPTEMNSAVTRRNAAVTFTL